MTRQLTASLAALLSISSASASAAPPAATRPTRSTDGFIYPGNTAEAARFNDRWDAYMKSVPATPTPDPEIADVDWMAGRWSAVPRDFPSAMVDPSTAERSPPSPATIAWTAGKRWLRISFVAQPWGAEWTYYLGHDPIVRQWVLHYLAGPSLTFGGPITARKWQADRLTFEPVIERYKGFEDRQRFVIVRIGPDSFRIVTEVQMPSGAFVAMDDVLFTRTRAPLGN